jgi:hypothetical protein
MALREILLTTMFSYGGNRKQEDPSDIFTQDSTPSPISWTSIALDAEVFYHLY